MRTIFQEYHEQALLIYEQHSHNIF